MADISVRTASAEYIVRIGSGVRESISNFIPATVRHVAIVVDEKLIDDVRTHLNISGNVIRIPFAAGESGKTMAAVESLCRQFAEIGLQRSDLVVAIGGGVVTDAVGFAAAVYKRGASFINVPTTLVGQVDAAIGGKTGVNLAEGKNLVGAFFQPLAVLCDTDFLSTLDPRDMRSGMGEICKCGLLINETLNGQSLEESIAKCVGLKARIVSADEREAGERALLNYGHTLAHALESVGAPFSHGEAVAVGLCFASHLAFRLDRIDESREKAICDEVASYGLPTSIDTAVGVDELLVRMSRDKKRTNQSDEHLTFVLDGPNGVEVVPSIPADVVSEALKEWSHG